MKNSNTNPKTSFVKVQGKKERRSVWKRALLLFASLVVVMAIAVFALDGYTDYGMQGYDYYSYGYSSDAPTNITISTPPPTHIASIITMATMESIVI